MPVFAQLRYSGPSAPLELEEAVVVGLPEAAKQASEQTSKEANRRKNQTSPRQRPERRPMERMSKRSRLEPV